MVGRRGTITIIAPEYLTAMEAVPGMGLDSTILLAVVDDVVAAILLVALLAVLAYENVLPPVAAALIGAVGLALLSVVAYKTAEAMLMKPKVGAPLPGRRGTALTELNPSGIVLVDGERWQAVSACSLAKGSPVVVLAVDGLRLTVGPWEAPGG